MVFKKLSAEEERLAKMWFQEDGKTPAEIAELLRRDKSTMTRLLVKKVKRKRDGRPVLLTKTQVDVLVTTLKSMIKKANCKYMVTAKMLKRATRTKASVRTIARALHARNIYFRPLRSKPLLTKQDVSDRKEFAEKYHTKSEAWWQEHIHMHIDCKHFSVFLHGKARHHAAAVGCRGAYREPRQGLDGPYVRPGKKSRPGFGGRGVIVLAGVGAGKVLMWEYIDGRSWSGAVAAEMYSGAMLHVLKKQYPGRRHFNVLEDNDPTGFKSSKGMAAKESSGIRAFEIPKRSPQLNVCDYSLWQEVNSRMRRQEKAWRPSKKENRTEYLRRLRRTAMRLPAAFINASIKDMRRRCTRLRAAKGGHFEEGGK